MKKIISGIQQVGIGVPNVQEGFKWYRQNFGMDVPVFEEAAEANLMLPYTGGKPHKRHAILAINLKGGGGFEIWQYTSRTPQPAIFNIQLGDLGILAAKIKTDNINSAFDHFKNKKATIITSINEAPNGSKHFFLKDPFNNLFEVVESNDWFTNKQCHTGGPAGVIIGVSNMERSVNFYQTILGYDKIVYDKEGEFSDLDGIAGGNKKFRRVLLTHSEKRKGPFSKMLGDSSIELIQAYNYTPRKVFENRYWGDLGFIHLCFDIKGMDVLKKECEQAGHPFTVDSGSSFDMGEAAGRFSYIEDPDGTLIEFVETHKVPIMKKWGWYLDLRKRDPEKSLPNWMLKAMGMNRVKD